MAKVCRIHIGELVLTGVSQQDRQKAVAAIKAALARAAAGDVPPAPERLASRVTGAIERGVASALASTFNKGPPR